MAAISPGRPSGPPRKPKKPTATTKAHRFEPFSKRISKLKIDPVHRVDRNQPIEDDAGLSNSHFRASLDHWMELNLSQNFTDFSRRVNRLSESLPQLLHHADATMKLMLEYIEKRESLSMEPLLDLLAHFAHDLGQNFEKYFSEAVTLVASIAATHDAPEVIEWSFTCLAWMFKFLSRLLVPDLAPLLTIMTPYLGKSRQKQFVTRFAAESVAYLVRKAAAMHKKRSEPLDKALSFLFETLDGIDGDREKASFQAGLMTLFSEAIIGVDNGLHSSGADLFSCIVHHSLSNGGVHERRQEVLEGLTIALIHQTDADGFRPILEIVLSLAAQTTTDRQTGQVSLMTRLLLVVIGTRKGSRVNDWSSANRALLNTLQVTSQDKTISPTSRKDSLVALAMAMQYSPMNDVLPFIIPFTKLLVDPSYSSYFLSFCALFNDLGPARFQSLLLSHFQHFIALHWQDDQAALCILLDHLHGTGAISPIPNEPGYIACPSDWEHYIVRQFSEQFEDDEANFDVQIDAYAQLIRSISFPKELDNSKALAQILCNALKKVLNRSSATSDAASRFALGQGFKMYVQLAKQLDSIDQEIWGLVCNCPVQYLGLLPFLDAVVDYMDAGANYQDTSDILLRKLRLNLIENFLSRSDEIKMASLKILQRMTDSTDRWARDAISLALEIQSTSYSLQNVRQISMNIRRLSIIQKEGSLHPNFSKLIPYFALGLLSTYPGNMVQNVCSCLAEICERPENEDMISDIASNWLHEPNGTEEPQPGVNTSEETPSRLTPFQCSNMLRIEGLAMATFQAYADSSQGLVEEFEKSHRYESNKSPSLSRSLALQVLKAIPHLAEKRSRLIVPIFLSALPTHEYVTAGINSDASTSSHTMSPEIKEGDWSLVDRKAFLELFGKFTNPRVLYLSAEVYQSLLDLLTRGNADIQKLALKAMLTWKQSSLRLYEENLMRLLDEKTFRDELTTLFHTDQDHSSIDVAHRSELLPVLLRLLYGLMVNRSSSRNNHGGQESKRKATLRILFRLQDHEISQFLNIAFGPLAETQIVRENQIQDHLLSYNLVAFDQQLGLLKMVESMMEIMQTQLSSLGETIIHPVLYCTIRACRHMKDIGNEFESSPQSHMTLARNVRRVGIHCLDMIFKCCEGVQWPMYLPLIFNEVINPRLSKFAIETAQGVSGMLQLFSTWASTQSQVVFLQDYNKSVLDVVGQCLAISSAKDEVKVFVLDEIITKITQLAAEGPAFDGKVRAILRSHTQSLLIQIGTLLASKPGRKVLDSAIATLSELTPFVESSSESMSLIESLLIVLNSPSDRVSPKVKGNLLKAMRDLLNLHHADIEASLRSQIYEVVASLFNYFKDTYNRTTLTEILNIFALDDADLAAVAQICHGLNAQSSARLDEVDYDRSLNAFNSLNDLELAEMTPLQWQPLLSNLLYFSRNHEDFAIRSNAVASLRKFVEKAHQAQNDGWAALVRDVVLPALRTGVKEDSETIRSDHVSLFGLVVQHFGGAINLTDMTCLLAGNDEEASFFNNILHIQQHRRLRALRRLVTEVERGAINSSNICNFFLPLLEKYIYDPNENEVAHNLKGQAIIAAGALLEWTEWSQFKAILRRYRGYMDTKPQSEKDIIKLLGVAADALNRTAEAESTDLVNMESSIGEKPIPLLSKSLPGKDKVSNELVAHFIPSLAAFIHHKDESQISVRVPAAVVTVKFLKMLAQDQMAQLLPPILLDLAYILRSRTQESRDTARNTLSQISVLLGPSSIAYIIRELRTSLARGYQLHVLSYTLHSILVVTAPHLSAGDLDYCLPSLVSVVMDDIFGAVGQEKDAEDYVSKMKEVKSSKSFDSMELLATSTTVRHLVDLIEPLQTLLSGNLSSKQSRQVDELLRRIGAGLMRNPAAGSRDLLTFSYEIIQEIYNQKASVPKQKTNDEINRERFLVQLSPVDKTIGGTKSPFIYKLVRFAIDILRSTLQKHDSLLVAENLHGFVPVIGDALIQAQEEVKISALRLLSAIIRLPMSELDQSSPLYLIEAVKIVKDSINTNSEASQAALKLVTAILRERRNVSVRDSDLSYLLHRVSPDIEAPDKQGVTFNFIKAIMARRIVLPEVYELLDKIGIMMVTNHTQNARDVARGIYVNFLLEYPQSKSRWEKQVKFLVKNLDYKHSEGRQSVLEAVHLLLAKTGAELAQDIVGAFSIPVILLMVNDDHVSCREMAAGLLSQIFRKADEEQRKPLLGAIRAWIQQQDNPALVKTGMQSYKVFFEVANVSAGKEVSLVRTFIYETLKTHSDESDDQDWETIYHALRLFSKMVSEYPALTMTEDYKPLWSNICSLLSHSHPWIQNSSASLIGTWFHDLAKSNAESGLGTLPVIGSFGLQLDGESMIIMARLSLHILRQNWSNDDLSSHLVRNLIFLGRCFDTSNLPIEVNRKASQEQSEQPDEESSSASDSVDEQPSNNKTKIPAFEFILNQAASILRREPPKLKSSALAPKKSALKLLGALCQRADVSKLSPCLQNILLPLHHLTDPSIPAPRTADEDFQTAYRALVEDAQELMQILQKKLGDAVYVKAMTEVARAVRVRREGRRTKRRIEAVADPERFEEGKRRKHERKKVRKKEKGLEHRAKRRGW